MKKYSFFFHYNKPASLKSGTNKLSVHYKKVCYIVDSIKCEVPIESKNKIRQPRCIMFGKSNNICFINDIKNDKKIALIR